MPRTFPAKFASDCCVCEQPIAAGEPIKWVKGEGAWHSRCDSRRENLSDPEYARGFYDTRNAQMAGPAGSEAREQAYRDMEAQWAREGFDG